MNPAIKLVCRAMVADLGDAIASQVRDYVAGEEFGRQNPNAMRRAMEWIEAHESMLRLALSDDGYSEVECLAADIEEELLS